MEAAGAQLDIEVIKEPRGFIKIVEFLMSIFAFATTSGFSTYFAYRINADDCVNKGDNKYNYDYPFRLDDIEVANCNGTAKITGDFSSQSQYFVASGVLSFLYSLAALVYYLFKDKQYRENAMIPMADFWLTVVMAVFWLTSSSAWAQGLTDLKTFSNPDIFARRLCAGSTKGPGCLEKISGGSFATLNVSVLLGFVNFVLWAANLWFVYKDTSWFINRGGQGPENMNQPTIK